MKKIYCLVLTTAVMLLLTACSTAGDNTSYTAEHVTGSVWGTTFSVTYNTNGLAQETDIEDIIANALLRVDTIANAFDTTSVVARFNLTGKMDNPVPDDFVRLLDLSRRANIITQGAFDPTVAPLVDLWGFGKTNPDKLPDEKEIEDACRYVGIDKILYDKNGMKVSVPGVTLDLAAVAKGFGVDCVAEALQKAGITDYMVEIGGEVRVDGVNPRGERWRIQLDAPEPDVTGKHVPLGVLEMNGCCIATSGDYRNFAYDDAGNRFSHIISPATGHPVKTDVVSASVIADNTALADALATAAMQMDIEQTKAMIDSLNNEVYGAVIVTVKGKETIATVIGENNGRFNFTPVSGRNLRVVRI